MTIELTFEELNAGNEVIARWMGVSPEIEYSVGKDGSTVYSPAHTGYYPSTALQKAECERFLKDNPKYNEEGYQAEKFEWWPFYHNDWNVLIPALQKADKYFTDEGGASNNEMIMSIDSALDAFNAYNKLGTWNGLVAFIKTIPKR